MRDRGSAWPFLHWKNAVRSPWHSSTSCAHDLTFPPACKCIQTLGSNHLMDVLHAYMTCSPALTMLTCMQSSHINNYVGITSSLKE